MAAVEPIRDKRKITSLRRVLNDGTKKGERNYILFLLGISTGMRISDLLKLKRRNICDDYVRCRETKTKKYNKFYIIQTWKKDILDYIAPMNDDDYLFATASGKPMSRQRAYQIINCAAHQCGIKYAIGTHSMRKTFGYWFYKETNNLALLMLIFNHSDEAVTLKYIGFNEEYIKREIDKFSY